MQRWLASAVVLAAMAVWSCDDLQGRVTKDPPPVDRVPPSVLRTTPAAGAADVTRATTVAVVFDEPLLAATVSHDTLRLLDDSSTLVPSTVQYLPDTRTATVTPDAALQPYGQYTLEVLRGVQDLAGNALAAPLVITFRCVDDVLPDAPGTPTDAGSFSLTLQVDFAWTAATDEGSGVVSYRLQISTTPNTSNLILDSVIGPSLTHAFVAADGQVLYARVAAVDGVGNSGPWSDFSDGIRIDTTPPSAPGTPAHVGLVDDRWVRFTWAAAADPQSGITEYYLEIALAPDGTGVITTVTSIPTTEYVWDALAQDGSTVYVRARAVNGAGVASAWSNASDGVRVDATAPHVLAATPLGAGARVGGDLVLEFSEPMAESSVEAAFSLRDPDTLEPTHGYAFYWNTASDRLVVLPDTQNPAGIDNDDILAERTSYVMRLASTAVDLAGNALVDVGVDPWVPADFVQTFETRDITAPRLTAALVNGTDALRYPVAAVDVAGGDTIICQFSEDMLDVALQVGITKFRVSTVVVLYSHLQGLGVAWTGARELAITMGAQAALPGGDWYSLVVYGLQDTGGNIVNVSVPIQVAPASGTDSTAPVLMSSTPADTAVDVAVTQNIMLMFSELLAINTLANITVSGSGVTTADFVVEPAGAVQNSALVRLRPRHALPTSTTITMTIPDTVTDLAGNTVPQPTTVTLTTASQTDSAAPLPMDRLPPADRTVGVVDKVQVTFADTATGWLEPLAASSVDASAMRLVDETTGLLVRGWQARTEDTGQGVGWYPLPGEPGLTVGQDEQTVVSASAGSGSITFTTSAPPRLAAGYLVTVAGTSDSSFDVVAVAVTSVDVGARTFTVMSGLTGTATGGKVMWQYPKTYTVQVGTGGGMTDLAGNPVTPFSWSVEVSPPPDNRAPVVADLLSANTVVMTSASARMLNTSFMVVDPDQEIVEVQVSKEATGLLTEQVDTSAGSCPHATCSYVYPAQGMEFMLVPLPDTMTGANFPTSGYYWLAFRLADQSVETTFHQQVWVWQPSAVPSQESVAGQAVNPLAKILITDPTPTLAWSNIDVANAEYLTVFVVNRALQDGCAESEYAYAEMYALGPQETQFTLEAKQSLRPDMYMWSVSEAKSTHANALRVVGQGSGIDFSLGMDKCWFVYGPGNAALANLGYSMGQLGVFRQAGVFITAWDAFGASVFNAGQGDQTVVQALVYNNGNSASPTVLAETFAFDFSTWELMITQETALKSPPPPGRGFLGRGGLLWSVVQAGRLDPPYIAFGSYQFASSGFDAGSDDSYLDGPLVMAAYGVITPTPGVIQDVWAAHGQGVATGGSLAMTWRLNNDTSAPLNTSYTIDDNGLVTLNLPEATRGYVGGDTGQEIFTLTNNASTVHRSLALLARAYPWIGTETNASVTGSFHLALFEMDVDRTTGVVLTDSPTIWGSIDFDGVGAAQVTGYQATHDVTATWTYAVTPADQRVYVDDCALVAGPDLDTLFGVTRNNINRIRLMLLSK